MEYFIRVIPHKDFRKMASLTVKIPCPSNTATISTICSAGKAKYDPTQRAIVWRIRRVAGGAELEVRTSFEWLFRFDYANRHSQDFLLFHGACMHSIIVYLHSSTFWLNFEKANLELPKSNPQLVATRDSEPTAQQQAVEPWVHHSRVHCANV